MPKLRITRDDCDDIGFVRACLVAGIIDFAEFKQWLYYVIEIEDDLPEYFWDLMDIDSKLDFKPLRILGFNPYWQHTDIEDAALEGIGYKRYSGFKSDMIDQARTEHAMKQNPHIEKRFRETFPFIDW